MEEPLGLLPSPPLRGRHCNRKESTNLKLFPVHKLCKNIDLFRKKKILFIENKVHKLLGRYKRAMFPTDVLIRLCEQLKKSLIVP